MGNKQLRRDIFRQTIKREREGRGWSQAQLAAMLKERGTPMYHTTIAKIESGDRQVQIDEAAAIADLFRVPLDWLMGRAGLDNDLAYTLRAVDSTARNAQDQLAGIMVALGERRSDITALKFPGSDTLASRLAEASDALLQASLALRTVLAFDLSADGTVTVAQHPVRLEAQDIVKGDEHADTE